MLMKCISDLTIKAVGQVQEVGSQTDITSWIKC